jgi:AcrR family transcriptional regulator
MYLLANFSEPDPTKVALMRAGLELLAEKGYKGAITREVAARAGVSEVTLFRHFKSKEMLLQEAIQKLIPPIEQILPKASGDVEADLLELVSNYQKFLEANRGLMLRLLPELNRHPELHGELGPKGFQNAMASGFGFIAELQKTGRLRSDEPPSQAAIALFGPLFAKTLLLGALGIQWPFDLKAHVRGFLEGRRVHD